MRLKSESALIQYYEVIYDILHWSSHFELPQLMFSVLR